MAAGVGDDLINLQACFNAFGNCPTFEQNAIRGTGDDMIRAVSSSGEPANLVMPACGGSGHDTITANNDGAVLFGDLADGYHFHIARHLRRLRRGDDTWRR